MSLVTFIDNSAASQSSNLVMPAETAYPQRRILSIIVAGAGNIQGVCITITNCVADSGATFTAYLGSDGSAAATGNVFRGTTIQLPYKGLRVKADAVSTITMFHAAIASMAIIEYEKG